MFFSASNQESRIDCVVHIRVLSRYALRILYTVIVTQIRRTVRSCHFLRVLCGTRRLNVQQTALYIYVYLVAQTFILKYKYWNSPEIWVAVGDLGHCVTLQSSIAEAIWHRMVERNQILVIDLKLPITIFLPKKDQGNGKNIIVRNFTICTHHFIQFGCLHREWWGGYNM
jgi:hypothetical protein